MFIKIGVPSSRRGGRVSFSFFFVHFLPIANSVSVCKRVDVCIRVYKVSVCVCVFFVKKLADKVLLKRPNCGRCTFEGH